MTERLRHRYELELTGEWPAFDGGPSTRSPRPDDSDLLAELMLDAYRGTIDYEGETLADACREIADYFEGPALLDASRIDTARGSIRAACLVTFLQQDNAPLIAYVMTGSRWKRQGLAGRLLAQTLAGVASAGHARVLATITEGNVASENLFVGMGFARR